jgi:hypothetical protein
VNEDLVILFDVKTLDQDPAPAVTYPDDLGQQFTEMFMKKTENVSILLSLLQVNN